MRDLFRLLRASVLVVLVTHLSRSASLPNSSNGGDHEAATSAFRSYAEAIATEDFEAACGRLSRGSRAIVLATAAAAGLKTNNCAVALAHVTKHQASDRARARSAMRDSRSVLDDYYEVEVLGADRAVVVTEPPSSEGPQRLPLVKEDGHWKIGVLGLDDQTRPEPGPPDPA